MLNMYEGRIYARKVMEYCLYVSKTLFTIIKFPPDIDIISYIIK
jgi:hypothetical protein